MNKVKKFDDALPPLRGDELKDALKKGSADMPSLNNKTVEEGSSTANERIFKERRFGPAPVTTEKKVTIGFTVPESLRDAIDEMKEDQGMESIKGLFLTGLKNMGLDVPDEQIRVPKPRDRH
ncbi:MAG: hypothetical protein GY847_11320 [Proteobacteria bacterium]|nr:hypothetical protein [Pseudomonadota bacterium]